ncbi:hypothetical protein ACOMHN_007698 [Nucella lapillus]
MSMMRARVRGHRWVDHPAAAVMKARVPGQWVDCPAAVVMEAREQGRCWIDHPAVAVMEARVQGRHWVDRPSVGRLCVVVFDVWQIPAGLTCGACWDKEEEKVVQVLLPFLLAACPEKVFFAS